MKPSDPDHALSALLPEWRLVPRRDPNFRTAVWTRIGAARGRSPWPAYVRAHASVLAGALAAAMVIGAWIGREQARSRLEVDRAEIATAYVQALDARAMTVP